LGDSLESLSHQYKHSLEFTEELRLYIKEHLEREELGQEVILKEKVEEEKKAIIQEFEEKIEKMMMEIDEANAVNSQLREESE